MREAIESHIADLRRYARALLSDQIDAEELVQECLARALARRHFWPSIRDPRAYLFTVLHNAYVDGLAKRKRAGIHVDFNSVVTRLSSPPPQPASLELRDLARAMAELPSEQRETVLLVGLEGLTYRQAAEVLGVPIGTVMSRLSRGREFLRKAMDGEYTLPAQSSKQAATLSRMRRADDDDTLRHLG